MSDEVVTAPATDVAVIPPSEPAVLDGGNISDAWVSSLVESREAEPHPGYEYDPATRELIERPSSAAITTKSLGSTLDRPAPADKPGAALDERGDISQDLIDSIAAKMRTASPQSGKTAKAPAGLEEYGGMEGIERTMSIVSGLVHNPTTGALPFLQALSTQYPAAYWQLFDCFVKYEEANLVEAVEKAGNELIEGLYEKPEGVNNALAAIAKRDKATFEKIIFTSVAIAPALARRALIEIGQLPEELADPPTSRRLSPLMLAAIPLHLQGVAELIPPETLTEWVSANDREALIAELEAEKADIEYWNEQNAAAEQHAERIIANARQEGQRHLEDLSNGYVEKHTKTLDAWKPFKSEVFNEELRKLAMVASVDDLLNAKLPNGVPWMNLYHRMVGLLTDAPMFRLYGGKYADQAKQDEREGRELAERFNMRLKQMLRERINKLDAGIKQAVAELVEKTIRDEPEGPEPEKFHGGNISDEWWLWTVKKNRRAAAKGA